MTKKRAPYEAMTIDQAFEQAQHLLEGRALPYGIGESDADARFTRTLLVAGPPRSGKTEFALKVLYGGEPGTADKTAYDEATSAGAVMIVSNRTVADDLSLRVIHDVGQTALARPVTTLAALAFRIISTMRGRDGLPLPKLLNGAEQDAILRSVLASHVAHVRAGDQCGTCRLLAAYFASSNWTGLVSSQDGTDANTLGNSADDTRDASTDELFERGISDVFITQLRDMLARMNELGASSAKEDAIIATLADATDDAGIRGERLAAQWRAAFALRREYVAAINHTYPDEYRLDASRLLVEGTEAVRRALSDGLPPADAAIPRVVIVDDAQDVTLAGMAFLQAIEQSGSNLILIGNPDEAVQGFRGSYPEFLFLRATQQPLAADALAEDTSDDAAGMVNDRNLGRLGAFAIRLIPEGPVPEEVEEPHARVRADVWNAPDACSYSYRDLVAARTSLGILSLEPTSIPLPERLGKMPQWPGVSPISSLTGRDGETSPAVPAESPDGSVGAALYHSTGEELDDVAWRILHAHTIGHRSWNDMAVIAHDNSTVRAFGERLRREGVPVHYSSVTKPLKEEPFVQGLFAIIELALLREQGIDTTTMNARALAVFVRSRMRMLLGSPLVSVTTAGGAAHPLRVSAINAAMNSLESLSRVLSQNDRSDVGTAAESSGADRALLHAMMDDWADLRDRLLDGERRRDSDAISVDDSLMGGGSSEDTGSMGFGTDAMNLLLADGGEPSERVIQAIHSVLGSRDAKQEKTNQNGSDAAAGADSGKPRAKRAWTDPEAAAFERAWAMIDVVVEKLRSMPLKESRYVLWEAWQAAGVAERWQRQALRDDADGRAANDRLDTAMRLFQFAESSGAQHDVTAFVEQVRAMELEADSLAHVRPVEEAVTLTTPAGAIGHSWPLVWMPAVQQGVWPNLAARNTMFGVDDLADVMLHGRLASSLSGTGAGDVAPTRSERVASVLYGEKRSFLMAITRAESRVQVSAVSDDDHVPSDFLYGFMPELFVRKDPENKDVPFTHYTEVGQSERYHGLELSVRGIVTEARAILAAGRDIVGDKAFRDAADTLRYLSDRGVAYADPRNWPFVDAAFADGARDDDLPDDAVIFDTKALPDGLSKQERNQVDEQTASDGDKTAGPMVRLSPSAVDGIWNCPVCWLMDNQFVGPRPSSVATSFGTIIHAVAERASAEGLDLPDGQPGQTPEEKTAAITDRMLDIYAELRVDPEDIPSVAERYDAMYKDRSAGTLLRHIAEYFVDSATATGGPGAAGTYGRQGSKTSPVPVGAIESAACEKPFLARFDLNWILTAYNATPGVRQVGLDDFYGMLGALVGGWPEGMSKNLQVCISGRMDREETRVMDDGTRQLRLIDYKTGKSRSAKQNFSDLQLVCYQLGEQFDEQLLRTVNAGAATDGKPRKLPEMPFIGQSGLFFVKDKASPSYNRVAESCHQPALFRNGHINDQPFTPRYYASSIGKLFDEPVLPTVPPSGVSDTAWKILLDMRGTQTIWALTMIARVLYAAGAVQSTRLFADPDDEHVKHCWHKDACPACADDITSVLEVR